MDLISLGKCCKVYPKRCQCLIRNDKVLNGKGQKLYNINTAVAITVILSLNNFIISLTTYQRHLDFAKTRFRQANPLEMSSSSH